MRLRFCRVVCFMTSVFQINNLAFSYGTAPVLHDISLSLVEGEFAAIVGPNGAGKSTLLKIMAGLIHRYAGSVEFCGKPLSGFAARDLAKRIAFVPQETHMVFPFTVGEIVMMGRLPHRSSALFDSPRTLEWTRQAMLLTDTAALSSKSFNEL